MNKLEVLSLVRRGLRQHRGTEYGDISSIETVTPCPAEPDPHLIVTAPDPMGEARTYRITITEQEG